MSGPSPFISHRVGEGVVVAAVGGVLGGLVGWPLGLSVPAAIVGGLNGAISGFHGIYRWRGATGSVAFILDSTWALVTTLAALAAHLAAVLRRRPGYRADLSRRRDRHVYARGLQTRRGFLLTVGNVVSGATPGRHDRVVERHEHVHVWQARWFGPLFPLIYGGWFVGGVLTGVVAWLVRLRRAHRLGETVDAMAYYRNPFEWWAYSREGRWPPPRAVTPLVWRRPAVSRRER